MSEQALPFGQVHALPLTSCPTVSQQPNAPYSSLGSRLVSGICASLLVAALGSMLWFSMTLPKLQRFENPDRALELMVGRMLEAQDGLQRSPAWQQWVAAWTMGSTDETYVEAIQWYRELVATTHDPVSKLRLAILLGESGRNTAALAEAKRWQDRVNAGPFYGQLIEAAYGTQPLSAIQETELQAMLAEVLPNGWFYNHLAARLAQRAEHQALLTAAQQQSLANENRVQQGIRPLILVELLCLATGSVMLLGVVRLRRQRTDILRIHSPGVPPSWSGETAAAVILRGGALGVLLTVAFLSSPTFEQSSLRVLAIPLANLPLLILAYVQLLKPAGLTFSNSFGLRITSGNIGRLICIILAVVAAGLWGEWVMGRTTEYLKLSNHWTEWFDQNLVWAPPSIMATSLLEYVILAPIFEELAFRGLFFAMLRRRFTFLPAALLSAGIFALAHGYSPIGFISVFWSGFLWAWIYERTGSLIPGMIAHAMNNLLVCLTVMALLR